MESDADRLWRRFERQDFAGQIALFVQSLDEPELMDDEMAFQMMSQIKQQAIRANDRDRVEELMGLLRQRLPHVYGESAGYYLPWRISTAVTAGRVDAVRALSNELAALGSEHIDHLNQVIDQLAYHGYASILDEITRAAWPSVNDSTGLVPGAASRFAVQAAGFALFAYLEQRPCPDADDPELLERIQSYPGFDRNMFAEYLRYLTGRGARHWTIDDFQLKPPQQRADDQDWDQDEDEDEDEDSGSREEDPGALNLYYLTGEFLGYLRHELGVPYTKGEIARAEICRYLLERHSGELRPRQSMLDAAMGRKPPKPKSPPPDHPLCTHRETFEIYLLRLFPFLNPQPYKAAAVFEMVPAWLRFLESRQLLDPQRRQRALRELVGLDTDLGNIYHDDPAVIQAMKNWRQDAGIAA